VDRNPPPTFAVDDCSFAVGSGQLIGLKWAPTSLCGTQDGRPGPLLSLAVEQGNTIASCKSSALKLC
jgi:hypothetical protein